MEKGVRVVDVLTGWWGERIYDGNGGAATTC